MAPDQPAAPTPIRESAAQVCEQKAAHIRANADALKKFGFASAVDEGRCRELAALFLDEVAETLRDYPSLEPLRELAKAAQDERITTLERTLSERDERIAELEAGLRELVRLKDLSDEIDKAPSVSWKARKNPWSKREHEYASCKPLAWEAARRLLENDK